MLAEMKLGENTKAAVAHRDGSTLLNLTIQDRDGDWIFLTAPEVEELREMLNHWHDSARTEAQRLADAELSARPVTRWEWEKARDANGIAYAYTGIGYVPSLTAAGRVYVHSIRQDAKG